MLKITNKNKENVIPMMDMKPLQVGIIEKCDSLPYKNNIVMRTASTSTFEVMNLTSPGKDVCWTSHHNNIMVKLLPSNEVITIEIFNEEK